MNIIRIPKRNGSFRTIYAPSADEKKRLNELRPQIEDLARKVDKRDVAHGFRKGRSPVTNAQAHIGFAYTLKMDLSDFFDSVTPNHVPEAIRFPECFPDGAARQGLPTSPALANIAAAAMDDEILEYCPPLKYTTRSFDLLGDCDSKCAYTRYADDLTFSSDYIERLRALRALVPQIAEKYGFKVNTRKTVIMAAKSGARIITGIAVNETTIQPTRAMKRRLRAAKHKRNTSEARGLMEWISLKEPRRQPTTSTVAKAIAAVVNVVVKKIESLERALLRTFDFD